jgi:hypothetical protein
MDCLCDASLKVGAEALKEGLFSSEICFLDWCLNAVELPDDERHGFVEWVGRRHVTGPP